MYGENCKMMVEDPKGNLWPLTQNNTNRRFGEKQKQKQHFQHSTSTFL